MPFTVDISSTVDQRLLVDEPAKCRRAMMYALASTGKFLRDIIKREGTTASHGGYLGWPPASPFTGTLAKSRRDSSWNTQYRGRGKGRYRFGSKSDSSSRGFNPLHLSTRTEPMAKLIGAVRYVTDGTGMKATIGFVDQRLWPMVLKDEAGFTTQMTPRMQRLFYGLGLAVPKDKSSIVSPARDWIDAVYAREMGNAKKHFDYAFHWGYGQLAAGGGIDRLAGSGLYLKQKISADYADGASADKKGFPMIESKDIGLAIFNRLLDSAPILAQSLALFSGPHGVFYGKGGELSPEATLLPRYLILPMIKDQSQQASADYEFLIGCIFECDQVDSGITSSGVLWQRVLGYDYLETMLDLAWNEVQAVSSNLEWNKGVWEYGPVELFPVFSGLARLTARVTRVLGATLGL